MLSDYVGVLANVHKVLQQLHIDLPGHRIHYRLVHVGNEDLGEGSDSKILNEELKLAIVVECECVNILPLKLPLELKESAHLKSVLCKHSLDIGSKLPRYMVCFEHGLVLWVCWLDRALSWRYLRQ